jgi:hypothetical protein
MNFIQRLIRAYREARTSVTYDLLADTPEFWTDDDGAYVAAFFASSTGQKLSARLTNYVVRCAVEATRQTDNQIYHNGVARGVAMSVSAIENHFARAPRREPTLEQQPSPGGVAAFGFN